MQGASAPLVRHDRLTACFAPTLQLPHGRGQARSGQGEGRTKRARKPRDCGKTVLCTDRQEREPPRLGLAYRRQAKAAERWRISQSRRPGLGWPASPGTARKLSVPALSGCLALWLSRLVWWRLHERHLAVGGERLTERLRGRPEAWVV